MADIHTTQVGQLMKKEWVISLTDFVIAGTILGYDEIQVSNALDDAEIGQSCNNSLVVIYREYLDQFGIISSPDSQEILQHIATALCEAVKEARIFLIDI